MRNAASQDSETTSFSPLKWFRNISISKKLYFVLGLMAVLIALELATLFFAVNTLSSVRAFVGGEGLWSKAQKDAIYSLRTYARVENDDYYKEYLEYLKVPLGDRKARVEMAKLNPDVEIIRQGFLEGRNHPDDIDGMIKLFRRFHGISYINKAIRVWGEADSLLMELQTAADTLHYFVQKKDATFEQTEANLDRINELNKQLTVKEDEFSATLGEGSRWLEDLVLKLLFAIALTVEISGLLLTISVSRDISKGINETMRVVKKVAKGDFKERAQVFSKDEIGQLAESFNNMTDDLEKNITERKKIEKELVETQIGLEKRVEERTEELMHINKKLETTNLELESFAYITSHDLKAPLRAIGSLSDWLYSDYADKLDESGKEQLLLLKKRVSKMHELIEGILHYSRIGRLNGEKELIDTHQLIKEIKDLIQIPSHIKIITDKQLPVILNYRTNITQLFENLLTNAVKYCDKSEGIIKISCDDLPDAWRFTLSDNGPGIDKKYHAKIFEIFQTLKTNGNEEGTGIGLTIVKKIVESSGGQIRLESELGMGTKFIITLPKV
jgi:signal transduction histidine kinase